MRQTCLWAGAKPGRGTRGNTALERAGRSERIDHRSLDVQRAEAEQEVERARAGGQDELALEHEKKVVELSREPEPKIGPSANAQEKRGIVTERGEAFRAAQARNAQRQELGWRQLELRLELMERGAPSLPPRASGWISFGAAPRRRCHGSRRGLWARSRGRGLVPSGAIWMRVGRRCWGAMLIAPRCKRRMSSGERAPSDDPIRERLNAVLGRGRDIGQERDAAAVERDIVAGGELGGRMTFSGAGVILRPSAGRAAIATESVDGRKTHDPPE